MKKIVSLNKSNKLNNSLKRLGTLRLMITKTRLLHNHQTKIVIEMIEISPTKIVMGEVPEEIDGQIIQIMEEEATNIMTIIMIEIKISK